MKLHVEVQVTDGGMEPQYQGDPLLRHCLGAADSVDTNCVTPYMLYYHKSDSFGTQSHALTPIPGNPSSYLQHCFKTGVPKHGAVVCGTTVLKRLRVFLAMADPLGGVQSSCKGRQSNGSKWSLYSRSVFQRFCDQSAHFLRI